MRIENVFLGSLLTSDTSLVGFNEFAYSWARELRIWVPKFSFQIPVLHTKPVAAYKVKRLCLSLVHMIQSRKSVSCAEVQLHMVHGVGS